MINIVNKRKRIELYGKIVNKIDNRISVPKLYDYYFNYINSIIKQVTSVDPNKYCPDSESKINSKKIWFMWWQGIEQAPQIVKINFQNLKSIFGEDNVILITQKNYKNYTNISNEIAKLVSEEKIGFANWSDIVRFNILRNHGGLWIDATVAVSPRFKEYYEKNKDIFLTLGSEKKNYRNVSNGRWVIWLIGGEKDYYLFRFIDDFYANYFKEYSSVLEYFLTDDIINYFYNSNSFFKKEIDNLAVFPKWERYYMFDRLKDNYDKSVIDKFNTELLYSVQKLSYKYLTSWEESGTLLHHILEEGYGE